MNGLTLTYILWESKSYDLYLWFHKQQNVPHTATYPISYLFVDIYEEQFIYNIGLFKLV